MPSNIWVGVGLMKPAQVTFPLAPVYERAGIGVVQAAAREIHPEGGQDSRLRVPRTSGTGRRLGSACSRRSPGFDQGALSAVPEETVESPREDRRDPEAASLPVSV